MIKILYKEDSHKNIRVIYFEAKTNGNLHINHGILNGILQEDVVKCKPKNIGKKNETTAAEQAILELQSRYNKKLDQGYKVSIEEAKSKSGTDVSGNLKPMLAHQYEDKAHTIKFPVLSQYKYDGIRGLVAITIKNDISKLNIEIKATTRNGKPIQLWTNIYNDFVSLANNMFYRGISEIILDGEFYSNILKFEVINGIVKNHKNYTITELNKMFYICFDVVKLCDDFQSRFYHNELIESVKFETGIDGLISNEIPLDNSKLKHVKIAPTFVVNSKESLSEILTCALSNGYEGLMIRPFNGYYECKRSKNLLKLKLMQDDEFEIVDVEEGADEIGIFVCETSKGDTFKVNFKKTLEEKQDILKNKNDYIGKKLTVQFQEYTTYGIPRFPVGIRIRDGEL
jgi:DNA ligase-1